VACDNEDLDDMTGIWENKGSVVEIKREVITFRKDRETHGRYFSGNFDRENWSIKRMNANKKEKYTSGGKIYDQVCKRGKDRKNHRLRHKTTTCKNMMRLSANIWLHRGWHAPCELPRICSSSALLWVMGSSIKTK
jgi:hypothetical protein